MRLVILTTSWLPSRWKLVTSSSLTPRCLSQDCLKLRTNSWSPASVANMSLSLTSGSSRLVLSGQRWYMDWKVEETFSWFERSKWSQTKVVLTNLKYSSKFECWMMGCSPSFPMFRLSFDVWHPASYLGWWGAKRRNPQWRESDLMWESHSLPPSPLKNRIQMKLECTPHISYYPKRRKLFK